MPERDLKVLLELRPAFDGHAGIPQETRLLFRALRRMQGVSAEGLIQSSGHVLSPGLPAGTEGRLDDRELYRLSRVVISARQQVHNPYLATVAMGVRSFFGAMEPLDRFDPAHFRDFLWQALFARTLHPDDLESVVTGGFRVARIPWTGMHRCGLATRWLPTPVYPQLDTRGFDVMIGETPYPGRVVAPTRLVIRYHDAIPLLMPHTIADMRYHQASHYHALRDNVRNGAEFACVSEATRRDLAAIFPQAAERATVIPNMVSHHYFPEESDPSLVAEIVRLRANAGIALANPQAVPRGIPAAPFDYLLMVATLEPRKNHAALLAAWEELRARGHPELKLVVVGMLGWGHEPIAKRLAPWIERGELFALEDVPPAELRRLYRHARATVCPSFGEGFDFPGIEAMRCGCPVIASDIPVHREVFGEAAQYFGPYSTPDLANAITTVVHGASGRREALVAAGHETSTVYLPDAILEQWQTFLLTPART